MAIPDFQSLMLPLLRSLADGSERSTQETLDALAEELGLTEADVTQPMRSRKSPLFTNRVAWAKLHLKRAGLIDSPRRGVYRLTERGRAVLRTPPNRLNLAYLAQFPEYVEFRARSQSGAKCRDRVRIQLAARGRATCRYPNRLEAASNVSQLTAL